MIIALDTILDELDYRRQRATYGAVAAITGRPAAFLMARQSRDWRHSWIVNQRSQMPTGYAPAEIHPDINVNPRVIADPEELMAWLGSLTGTPDSVVESIPAAARTNPWDSLSTGDLLGAYAGVMRALRSRGVIRSSNNPVADLAENLAGRAFRLTLSEQSAKGYDALDADGGRWQIKGRRRTPENRSTQLGVLRGLEEDRFDWLLAILFDEQFNVLAGYRIPHAAVREHALYSTTQKAHIIHLKSRLLNDSRCVNITLELKAAAKTYFEHPPEPAV